MRKRFLPFLVLLILPGLIIYLVSCKHDPKVPLEKVCFDEDVQPMLNSYCAKSGCHDVTTQEAGIILSSYEEIIKHVSKGDPRSSQIYEAITARAGSESHMPPSGHTELSYQNVRDLYVWILQGAEHTTCNGGECDTSNVTYNGTVYPIFETYCNGCHSGAAPSAGIDLTDFSTVTTIVNNGRLHGSINGSSGYVSMPYNSSLLSDCPLSQINKWIRDTTLVNPPNGDPCDPDSVYFNNDLLPILVSNCAKSGCHDNTTHAEGVNLTTYAKVISTAGVSPFNPGNSKLYKVITNTEPDDRMPPSPASPLTSDQISLVNKWITQGALNLSCTADCDSVNITFSNTIWPTIQSNCTGCHSGTSPSGGISLTNYSQVQTIAADGSLLGSITWSSGFSPMPKNGDKFSICKIGQIRKWINDGSPNNLRK